MPNCWKTCQFLQANFTEVEEFVRKMIIKTFESSYLYRDNHINSSVGRVSTLGSGGGGGS